MAKIKYIRCDIYKRGIYIFIGSPQELIAWSEKTFKSEDYKEFNEGLKECSYGEADFHYTNEDGCGLVRIPKFPKTPAEIAYTTHELLHATMWLLWYCGVEYDPEGANEAYTYLLEHLVRNTFEKEGYEIVEKD